MWNAGSTPARMIEVIAPAGFEHFFWGLADAFEDGLRIPRSCNDWPPSTGSSSANRPGCRTSSSATGSLRSADGRRRDRRRDTESPARTGAAASLVRMAVVVLGLHLLGGILLLTSAGHDVRSPGSGPAFGVSIGFTAYLLGMRHAFDVDHIAAIDSTTRKLLGDRIRTRSVGFWFSLGHSSVVLLLCTALAAGARLAGSLLTPADGGVRNTLALLGTTCRAPSCADSGCSTSGSSFASCPFPTASGRASRRSDRTEGSPGAGSPPTHAHRHAALAHVPRRPPLRARIRHRIRNRPARGRRGAAMAACLGSPPSLPILFTAGMACPDTLDGVMTYGWTSRRTGSIPHLTVSAAVVTVGDHRVHPSR